MNSDEEVMEEDDKPKAEKRVRFAVSSNTKLRRRAEHFRRLFSQTEDSGLISRLPDELMLESVIGHVQVLDGVVEDDPEKTAARNEWYSSAKEAMARKARRTKKTAFRRGEDQIGETEINLRILHQCMDSAVQEIIANRIRQEDPDFQRAMLEERESILESIVDEIFDQVLCRE